MESISAILNSKDLLKEKASKIRILLSQLLGVLNPHFSSEDRLLYPSLMKSEKAEVSDIAKRFWAEMGEITDTVKLFLNRWRQIGEIETHAEIFAADFKRISLALKSRIDAEEKELYPLFLKMTSGK